MLTAVQFAREAGVSYTTAMSWLKQGLVPGAEKKADHRGEYWEIPDAALKMERPKPGRPPKKKDEEKGASGKRRHKG